MSLTLAITIIVLADITLIGLLAFVMSRASRLAPHPGGADEARRRTVSPRPQAPRAPARASRIPVSSRS